MSIYDGDQPTGTAVLINGVMTTVNAAQLKAIAPANSVYTFTAPFGFTYSGQQLSYRTGVSYILDPALKEALLAISAPMIAA